MDRIVDCHAHIFPHLGAASGFESAELHLLFQQWAMHHHTNQPVRRLSDHQIVHDRPLWRSGDWSSAGRVTGLNFRVGKFGRLLWDKDGETYYIQFFAPSLQEMHCPAEFMVAQMQHAGIQTAILQNDHIYGNLDTYFTQAIQSFPDRFLGLAQVEEGFAYREEQMESLVTGIEEHGLSGLYFSLSGFFRSGYQHDFDSPVFAPFWNTVQRLSIPVFWVFPGGSPCGGYAEEMNVFRRWLERYPAVSSVLVHGLPTALFADQKDRLTWPEYVTTIMENFSVYSEVLYPIAWGGRMEYPYPRAQGHIRQLFDRFGPDRLLWGSDMPNVERYCSYRQSLTYFSEHSEYLTAVDREKIFGGNALRLLGRTARGARAQ